MLSRLDKSHAVNDLILFVVDKGGYDNRVWISSFGSWAK